MSKYTTEIRFLCESVTGHIESQGFNQINDIIEESAPIIFNFDFPIFDENYRLPLEIKILRHFYTREISEETVGLWKLRLQDRLCNIMPYYNQLYASELIKFNPMYDVDYFHESVNNMDRRTATGNNQNIEYNLTENENGTIENVQVNDGVSNSTSERDSSVNSDNTTTQAVNSNANSNTRSTNVDDNTENNWVLFSDTPQGGIDGISGIAHIPSGTGGTTIDKGYLTNATNELKNAHREGNNSTVGAENSNSASTTTNDSDTTSNETLNGSVNMHNVTRDDNKYNRDKTSTNIGNISNTGTNNFNGLDQYLLHVYGKRYSVTYSSLLNEFRTTFLNIDRMILEELEDLFFGLWM